jgi:cytochrome bd-type quinol oxidase subunit 1
VLILLAVTFTWLMGLMGFARSGIRQHWHVYGVIRDTSPEAWTPALGYAAKMISVVTILFFALVMLIFWLGGLGEKRKAAAGATPASPAARGATPGD